MLSLQHGQRLGTDTASAAAAAAGSRLALDESRQLDLPRPSASLLLQIEVARNLSAAKARLEQLRKEHATHIGSLRQTVHDHREALTAAKQSNASLESQVSPCQRGFCVRAAMCQRSLRALFTCASVLALLLLKSPADPHCCCGADSACFATSARGESASRFGRQLSATVSDCSRQRCLAITASKPHDAGDVEGLRRRLG